MSGAFVLVDEVEQYREEYSAVRFLSEESVSTTEHKDAEEAGNQFPDLLDAAERGRSTIITKHGQPVAALVPIEELVDRNAQRSLLPLKGTGRGLWGKNSTRTLRALRDEEMNDEVRMKNEE